MTTRKGKQENPDSYVLSVQDMEDAEVAIIRFCQKQGYLQEIWQQMWDTGNEVGKSRYSGGYRREENVLSRLIRHTGLNKTMQLMSKHPTGCCEWCGENETVEHVIIIMYCEKYTDD